MGNKSKDELKKLLFTFTEFIPGSGIQDNALTFIIRTNENIECWKKACLPGFSISTKDSDKPFQNITIEKVRNILPYILATCLKAELDIITKYDLIISKEKDNFFNGFLYSHLFTKDKISTTPLIHAVMLGNFSMVLYFLGFGCDINETDSEGRTALMYSVLNGNKKIMDLLLNENKTYKHEQTVDVDSVDKKKKSALMYCLEPMLENKEKSYPMRNEAFDLLLIKEANTQLKEKDGNTIIDYLHDLPNNNIYLQILKQHSHNVSKIKPCIVEKKEEDMAENPKYDYQKDCEKYLEKKAKKMQDQQSTKPEKVAVDPLTELVDKTEVVKGDNL